MAIEPVYENLSLISLKPTCDVYLDVVSKLEINTQEVAKVLLVSALPTLGEAIEKDGKIIFNGRVVFYACYETLDGEIKKCEKTADFDGRIEDAECLKILKNNSLSQIVELAKCDYSLVDGEFNVKAKIKVSTKIYGEEKLSALSGGEGIIADVREVPIEKSFGIRKTIFPIEEEFELNYQVQEVLSQTAKTNITAAQCGVGCIIVDGEIFLNALLLQKVEKSDIIKENRVIPFRVEIEYDEAMPVMKAAAFVSEKNIKTDIQVDEDSGKSIVKIKVNLCFYGEAMAQETVSLVLDAFAKTEEVEADFGEYNFYCDREKRTFESNVIEKAPVENLPAGIRLMAIEVEGIEIASKECLDSGVNLSGVINAMAFFRDTEGKNTAQKLCAPFSVSTDFCLDSCLDIEVTAICKNIQARVISLSQIELNAKIVFILESKKQMALKYIKEVKSLGEKEINDHAISVFIPEENEELWSLAKRLNVSPKELLEINKELQFPLTGKERIVIYRKR